jgi:hypothetical protein
VGVEVAALLALAVDQQVVAVEDRVIAGTQNAAGDNGDERRAAGGGDVEAFMPATAAARCAEFADIAARPVPSVDREDVRVEPRASIASHDRRHQEQKCQSRRSHGKADAAARAHPYLILCALAGAGQSPRSVQWCSMTRSTMLYSFASSAVMK